MSEAIIVAIITGGLAFLGTCLTVAAGVKKNQKQIEINQAVTTEKIAELTREVRIHNDFARRVPLCEQRLDQIEKQIERRQ